MWLGAFAAEFATPIRPPWLQNVRIDLPAADWRTAWPRILARDGWACLKEDRNGTVHRGIVRLGSQDIDLVVKQPRRSRTSQWVTDFFRPNRARRSWYRTRRVLANGIKTEVPLLLAERRLVGLGRPALEQIAVFLAVPGKPLPAVNLSRFRGRDELFHWIGVVLGDLALAGLEHRDAKAPNWLISGIDPVLVDCDAISPGRDRFRGFNRFVRSFDLLQNPIPDDLDALCEGFSAFAPPECWPIRTKRLVAQTRERYAT